MTAELCQLMDVIWKPAELERVPCDLCGSQNQHKLYTRPDGMTVEECAGCGLAFLNPRPKPEHIKRLYQESYFQKAGSSPACGYTDYLTDENRWGMLDLARIRLAVLQGSWSPRGKRCLEIGCASGEFCHVLARLGATPTGIDVSEFAIRTARQRYPSLDFQEGGIEAVRANGKFDAVFGFELIEHVLSPRDFLGVAAQLIAGDGLLVLTTPNLACGKKVGFERWAGFHASFEHLYFLAPETMGQYARLTGLELLSWHTGFGDGDKRWIVHPAAGHSPNPLKVRLKALLRSAGLLDPVRQLRRMFRDYGNMYSDQGEQHNLFVILKRADRHPRA
jgi:2-polyprenyl-3-methyl-5-hydroxy-6-metoxy-1,4-benzoquinol methylase